MSPYHGEVSAWEAAMLRLEERLTARFEKKLKKLRKRIRKLEAAQDKTP